MPNVSAGLLLRQPLYLLCSTLAGVADVVFRAIISFESNNCTNREVTILCLCHMI